MKNPIQYNLKETVINSMGYSAKLIENSWGEDKPNLFCFPPHWHDCYELLLVVSGSLIIRNNDIIPVDTDITQFILYKPDSRVGLLRIGNNYTSNSVANQLGNPMNRTYSHDVLDTRINSNGETEEKHKIIYNYHGMVLIFEGYFTDINDWMWDGELCAIKMISENDFVLGKGISNGMTLENLLSIYPFLDIFGYRINHFSDNLNYSITFTIDENNVVSNIEAKKD